MCSCHHRLKSSLWPLLGIICFAPGISCHDLVRLPDGSCSSWSSLYIIPSNAGMDFRKQNSNKTTLTEGESLWPIIHGPLLPSSNTKFIHEIYCNWWDDNGMERQHSECSVIQFWHQCHSNGWSFFHFNFLTFFHLKNILLVWLYNWHIWFPYDSEHKTRPPLNLMLLRASHVWCGFIPSQ